MGARELLFAEPGDHDARGRGKAARQGSAIEGEYGTGDAAIRMI